MAELANGGRKEVKVSGRRCMEFEVHLCKTGKLGLRLGAKEFVVQSVSDGIVFEYNTGCEAERTVVVGDRVTHVNGREGTPKDLLGLIGNTPQNGNVVLSIQRQI